MKVLQNLAVLTAVVLIGACSVSPENTFLDAVKGKTVVVNGTDTYKFSSDGREVDSIPATGAPATFKEATSKLSATYQLGTTTVTIKLNKGKTGGTFDFGTGEQTGTLK